jgi:putative SOS response-associated peptidase YedK
MCYFNGQKVRNVEVIRLRQLEKKVANYPFLNRDVINGFDFGKTAVLKPIEGKEDFDIVEMEWGFLPDPLVWPFIETRDDAYRIRHGYMDANKFFHEGLEMLNAKSEELLFKNKVFRRAALERKCIVLSTGFYEWRHVIGINKRTGLPLKTPRKIPYRILDRNRPYFWLGGIWQGWIDVDTGEYVETVAITTTDANAPMSVIHNKKKRMPTMPTDDLAYEWMFGRPDEKRITQIATYQANHEEMFAYTLAKGFLTSTEPLKPFHYPDVLPIEEFKHLDHLLELY